MDYTDEQIAAIRAAGFEINAETLQAMDDAFEKFMECIRVAIDAITKKLKPIIDLVADSCVKIIKLPPRQRYKMVKRLGVHNYPIFFSRKPIYRCRNNC